MSTESTLSHAFVVVAYHRTVAGFYLAGRPITRLAASATDVELGAVTRATLGASLRGLRTPRRAEYTPRLRDLAKAAGMRTWAALEKTARLCMVEETRGAIRVVPHRHGGSRGADAGYHALDETAFEPADNGDEALGAAVRRGIELSPGPTGPPTT
jgi:hypothetical protein